jgi:Cytochrome B6-F complex subunit VI (PetL)
MSGAIAYVVLLGVMFGIAMALNFGLKATKII